MGGLDSSSGAPWQAREAPSIHSTVWTPLSAEGLLRVMIMVIYLVGSFGPVPPVNTAMHMLGRASCRSVQQNRERERDAKERSGRLSEREQE